MKIPTYLRFEKPALSLFTLFCLFLFSTLSVQSQTNSTKKFNYHIPPGQILYSENTKNQKDLMPFEKEYFEVSDLGKVKVIESGNFVFKEYQEEGVLKRDTLWFAISTQRIENGDTLKSSQKLELKKQNNFSIDAKLTFEEDRIYIEQSDNQDNSIFAKLKKTNYSVHPDDEGLYFKLKPGEAFEFVRNSGKIGLMTIPFKIRNSNEGAIIPRSPETGFNNLELFLGLSIAKYKYRGGSFKKSSFSIGPFIGPGVVHLEEQNSALTEDNIKTVIGMNYGLAILGAIDRVNLGLAIGVETINNNQTNQWIFHKKIFFGFICGYSLNN